MKQHGTDLRYRGLHAMLVLALVCAASGQDRFIDVSASRGENRFVPAMKCERTSGEGLPHLSLRVQLQSADDYRIEEQKPLKFQFAIKNVGKSRVSLPVGPCAEELVQRLGPNFIDACINLPFDINGEHDWFAGSCLCGGASNKDSIRTIEPGEELIIRDKAKILLGDPLVFSELRRNSVINVTVGVWIGVSRTHLVAGQKLYEGCTQRIGEAEQKPSVPISILSNGD